jgi:hypothetical protein
MNSDAVMRESMPITDKRSSIANEGGDSMSTAFPTKVIQVNGTELHYQEQGQGDR